MPFKEDANFGGPCVAALSDHLSVFLEEGSSGGFIHRPTLALPSAAGAAGLRQQRMRRSLSRGFGCRIYLAR